MLRLPSGLLVPKGGVIAPGCKSPPFGGMIGGRLQRGSSTAAFTPASIPGLVLWLDATDLSTLFQDSSLTTPVAANSDPVGGWKDKSGGNKNATQTVAGSKPLLTVGW